MDDFSVTVREGALPLRRYEPPSGFESMFQNMALDLPLFEGPLDLLLHLIRSQRLDILDLPMALVTRQYMDFLLMMEELDLEIAAEFVAMAAQLVQIKSRMLLPLPPKEGEPEDPREDLVQRLLDYQAVKDAALELSGREREWMDIVYAGALELHESSEAADRPEPTADTLAECDGEAIKVTLIDILGAYRDALRRLLPPAPVEVRTPTKTLHQRVLEVAEQLRYANWLAFADLLSGVRSREELVLTFLALLELVKSGSARLVQTEVFGEIRVQTA
jgi:segregation and condensation protein A